MANTNRVGGGGFKPSGLSSESTKESQAKEAHPEIKIPKKQASESEFGRLNERQVDVSPDLLRTYSQTEQRYAIVAFKLSRLESTGQGQTAKAASVRSELNKLKASLDEIKESHPALRLEEECVRILHAKSAHYYPNSLEEKSDYSPEAKVLHAKFSLMVSLVKGSTVSGHLTEAHFDKISGVVNSPAYDDASKINILEKYLKEAHPNFGEIYQSRFQVD